jgi:hypothetical protein
MSGLLTPANEAIPAGDGRFRDQKSEQEEIGMQDETSEKRVYPRFKVTDTVFAMLEGEVERQPAQVVNVGRGGVCLNYFRDKCSCNWQQLTISSFHADCFLGQLPVEIVYEGPAEDEGEGSLKGMRRCGLKFTDPSYTQQVLWDMFIEQNAMAFNGHNWKSA